MFLVWIKKGSNKQSEQKKTKSEKAKTKIRSGKGSKRILSKKKMKNTNQSGERPEGNKHLRRS